MDSRTASGNLQGSELEKALVERAIVLKKLAEELIQLEPLVGLKSSQRHHLSRFLTEFQKLRAVDADLVKAEKLLDDFSNELRRNARLEFMAWTSKATELMKDLCYDTEDVNKVAELLFRNIYQSNNKKIDENSPLNYRELRLFIEVHENHLKCYLDKQSEELKKLANTLIKSEIFPETRLSQTKDLDHSLEQFKKLMENKKFHDAKILLDQFSTRLNRRLKRELDSVCEAIQSILEDVQKVEKRKKPFQLQIIHAGLVAEFQAIKSGEKKPDIKYDELLKFQGRISAEECRLNGLETDTTVQPFEMDCSPPESAPKKNQCYFFFLAFFAVAFILLDVEPTWATCTHNATGSAGSDFATPEAAYKSLTKTSSS